MNEKLLIRTTALLLLNEIYLKCDGDLVTCINPINIINDDIDETMIKKAESYLHEKGLIEGGNIMNNKWYISITSKGIDWVEEYYNIDPKDYINK